MDLSLYDPEHGAYSAGNLRIGFKGDFVTSPSLSSDFAQLLAKQLVQWFEELQSIWGKERQLSLVEVGPGEGHLIADLIPALENLKPELIANIQIILVEKNESFIHRQKKKLGLISKVPIHWKTFEDLSKEPVIGLIIAHEMLDALPVERIVFRNSYLCRQGVSLVMENDQVFTSFIDLPLTSKLSRFINNLSSSNGFNIPPDNANEGWSSELHIDLEPWFLNASKTLISGKLLVIDYALEAKRYYSAQRYSGTIISYKGQYATHKILDKPGESDLTSHVCIETMQYCALKAGWRYLGGTRQGQALLALGLAKHLYSVQNLANRDLAIALRKREALLRLVDPAGLGEFRWFAFSIDKEEKTSCLESESECEFLKIPIT